MADKYKALEEGIKKNSEILEYAREILQLLPEDALLEKAKEYSETVDKIASKLSVGKENTLATIKSK